VGQGTLRHLGPEEQLNLQAKQGRGHPLVGMRIVGDDGREKPWDGRSFGNLQVRGPHVVRGYYKVPLLNWDLTVLTLTLVFLCESFNFLGLRYRMMRCLKVTPRLPWSV
jgi:hypothetical protein